MGAAAIAAFGVDVARLYLDMTSISPYGGAYAEVEPGFVEARYGHPKDRRPDLKQVHTTCRHHRSRRDGSPRTP